MLFALMQKVYKTAYQDFWTDDGDWCLDVCYNSENLEIELSRDVSHYFFVEYQGSKVGMLKYDFPFSSKETGSEMP